MIHQLTIVVLGSIAAGFVQGLSGFAFGLVAMSIWAWTLDPTLAGPLVVFGSFAGQMVAARTILRGTRPVEAIPMVAGGIVGVPIGVALLKHIDPATFKTCVGMLLIVWCPAMLLSRNLPRVVWGGYWTDAAAGWIGGIMGGLGGLTGPVPILWGTLRGWDRRIQRVRFMVYNLTMQGLTFVVYLASGTVPRTALPLFAVMLPAVFAATALGFRLYHRVSDVTFRRVILGLLTAMGAVLVATGAVRWL